MHVRSGVGRAYVGALSHHSSVLRKVVPPVERLSTRTEYMYVCMHGHPDSEFAQQCALAALHAARVRRARIPPPPRSAPHSRACRHAPLPPGSFALASHLRSTEPRLLRPSAAVRSGAPGASRLLRPPDATRSLPAPPFSRGRRLEATLEPDARSWREPRSPAQRRCVARSASWTASLSRRRQEEPGARCTVWVRRKDASDAQFSAMKDVEVRSETVDSFRTRVASKLGLDPSLLNLHLVPCGSHKPTAEEEKGAVLLDDPSLSLRESGVSGTAWLLASLAPASTPGEHRWTLVLPPLSVCLTTLQALVVGSRSSWRCCSAKKTS